MRGSVVRRRTGFFIVFDAGKRYKNGCWVRAQKWEKVDGGKKEAQALLALRLAEVHKGEFKTLKQATVGELVERWWQQYAVSALRPSTQDKNRHLLNHIVPVFGGLPVSALAAEQIEAFKAEKLKTLSPRYVSHMLKLFRQVLDAGIRWDYLKANPCVGVADPTTHTDAMRCLSPQETKTLLEHGGRYGPLYRLAVTTGLRLGELLAMKWPYVLWDQARYRVEETLHYRTHQGFGPPKTKGSRTTVALTRTSLDELRSMPRDHDLVFCTGKGTPVNPRNVVLRHFEPALKRAGLPRIRFHDLRHTAASLMIDQGMHAKAVQRQMRHASIKMTFDTYGHLFPEAVDGGLAQLDRALAV